MRRIVVMLGLGALLLGACRAESVTLIRVDPDGKTAVISEIAFDDEALEAIGKNGDDPQEVLRLLSQLIDPSALPVAGDDSEIEQFERDDLRGVRVSIDGLDPSLVTDRVASGSSILDFVTIGVENEVLLMTGRTRAIPAVERETFAALAGGDISTVLNLVLRVEVPGTVTDHNADRIVSEGLLEWDLLPALTRGERVDVFVQAAVDPGFQFVDLAGEPFAPPPPVEPESGFSPWIALLAIAVAVSVSILIIRRIQAKSRLVDGFTPRS